MMSKETPLGSAIRTGVMLSLILPTMPVLALQDIKISFARSHSVFMLWDYILALEQWHAGRNLLSSYHMQSSLSKIQQP